MLPLSVYGYFQNGGSIAYIVPDPEHRRRPASRPSSPSRPPTGPSATRCTVTSVEPDADIAVAIERSTSRTTDETSTKGPSPFNLVVVENGQAVEQFPNADLHAGRPRRRDGGQRHLDQGEGRRSTWTRTSTSRRIIDVLKPGTFPLEKAAPAPVPVSGQKFSGSETARTGINGLAIADDVTMVIVPDLITAATKDDGTIDLGLWKAVQTALISHCEQQGNRMAILDAPPGHDRPADQGVAHATSPCTTRSSPRCTTRGSRSRTRPGTNGDREVFVPPSGHIAGVWARTDETRGVWKAPANDTIRGCPRHRAADHQERAVACSTRSASTASARSAPAGIRIWGARTLSSDSDWRYINVRRLFNMVETTILDGTQWAVFEPNDMKLWEGVSRTLDRVPDAACGGRAPCSVPRPTRPSTSSATPRPTRRSRSTRASSSSRSGSPRSSRPSSSSSGSASRSRSPAEARAALHAKEHACLVRPDQGRPARRHATSSSRSTARSSSPDRRSMA